jgi:xanthine dehydrogenase/oxidase
MAFNVFIKTNSNIVEKAYLTFGGMAPTTIFAKKTCEALINK